MVKLPSVQQLEAKLLDGILQQRNIKASDVEDSLRKAQRIIDPTLGIVKQLQEVPPYPGEPAFFQYIATLSNIDRVLDCPAFAEVGAGASIYPREAKMKALGEALERYCSCIRFDDELVYANFEELRQTALDPEALPVCSAREYSNPRNQLAKPRRDTKTFWSSCYSLTERHRLLVPANFVYLSHRYSSRKDMTWMPISTGLACGETPHEALLSGLCEVIERDAFMIMWLHQLSVPRIDLVGLKDRHFRERIDRLEKAGLEAFFFNITTEVQVPSILLLLLSKDRTIPVLTVTTAAHPNPRQAVIKVIDEAVATRNFCLAKLRQGYRPRVTVNNPAEITQLEDHLFAYIHPDTLATFDFLFKHSTVVSLDQLRDFSHVDLSTTLREILASLRKWNLEVIAADITTDDVREVGFTVLRVLVPQMVPLSQDHNIRFLGVKRLYDAPKRMGYGSRTRQESALTGLPHPFA